MIAGAGGILACGAAVIGSLWRARQTGDVTTYGSARWANTREIAAAGLRAGAGVMLGRAGRGYLRHDGPEHVMAFAPTRSGKGVGLVVPSLLAWTGSAVIHDIKGENWQLTAGWRARFSHCLLLNPTDPRSAHYNPLLEVRRGADEVRDVQNIADVLVDPEGALERRNHWEKTSHALLVGAILHVLYAEADTRTYIEFPASLAVGEAPPLFVIADGKAELANYRVAGRYYIVDRLFDAAELRLGTHHREVVRITRQDSGNGRA